MGRSIFILRTDQLENGRYKRPPFTIHAIESSGPKTTLADLEDIFRWALLRCPLRMTRGAQISPKPDEERHSLHQGHGGCDSDSAYVQNRLIVTTNDIFGPVCRERVATCATCAGSPEMGHNKGRGESQTGSNKKGPISSGCLNCWEPVVSSLGLIVIQLEGTLNLLVTG